MIRLLDESLEDFLRAEVPLPQGEIDLSFDTPDAAWAAGVNQPTVNAFFWDLRRSPDESRSGHVRSAGTNGAIGYQFVPPRIECRYLLTAWATDVRDEHQILGAVLSTLLLSAKVPEQYLHGALRSGLPRPSLFAASANAKDFVEIWSALQGTIKPGIDLVATVTFDGAVLLPAGPPIGGIQASSADTTNPERESVAERRGGRVTDPDAIGAVISGADDAALVSDDGTFWIKTAPGDTLIVQTDPPKSIIVPDRGPIWIEG